jgi:hypothetical protein
MSGGGNRRVEMEMTLIRLCTPELDESGESLLRRLDQVEKEVKYAKLRTESSTEESEMEAEAKPKTRKKQAAEKEPLPTPSMEGLPKPVQSEELKDWPEVLEALQDLSPGLAAFLENSRAYIDGEYCLIDAPNGIFKTKDGYMQLTCGPQPMFMRVRDVIEDPILQDEKYIDVNNRIKDADLLVGRITAWMAERTCAEVDELMAENSVTCGKICTWDDVLNDRQLAYREDLIQLPVKNCGTIPYAKFPAHFSGHEYITDTRVPELGENNVEVLSGLLGMAPEEIEAYTK